MLSILIPTYNHAIALLVETLQEQAKSLQVDYEIRVYEDGSTQFLEENKVVERFPDVVYKQRKENVGRTAIRAQLAEDAQFTYLLFLDADVFPADKFFLERYIKMIKQSPEVVFGGIAYEEQKPEKEKVLRWKYGKEREAKSVAERMKSPYFIISQNLLIRRRLFMNANNLKQNLYGLDNYFSSRLKERNAVVEHIDNPVVHYGLESSEVFIKKALEAVKTTVVLEERKIMSEDMRPLQKSYIILKRWGMIGIFTKMISRFQARMEQNFISDNPNLLWFDLYRLNYYIQLKKEMNA